MSDFDDDEQRKLLKENMAAARPDMIRYGLAAIFMLGVTVCVTWIAAPIILDTEFENTLSISLTVASIASVMLVVIFALIFTASWRDWRAARKQLKKLQK